MYIDTVLKITFGIALGFFLGMIFNYMPKTKPQMCPNGVVGQIINPDGTTYCSYISGKYKAVSRWERNPNEK